MGWPGRVGWVAGLVAAVIAVSGCVVLRHPTEQDVAVGQRLWPELTLGELEAGRRAYVRRCSGCHALHLPESLGAREWLEQMEEMAVEAKLTPEERALIERFLLVTSGDVGTLAGAPRSDGGG